MEPSDTRSTRPDHRFWPVGWQAALLLGLLAFIRTAHYWTETHPDLPLEPDAIAFLDGHPQLARLLADPVGAVAASPRSAWHAAAADLAAARESLAASEQRYRALFESVDAGFNLVQAIPGNGHSGYRVVESNPAQARLTGQPAGAGRPARDLIRHGPGHGRLRIHVTTSTLRCEVSDPGPSSSDGRAPDGAGGQAPGVPGAVPWPRPSAGPQPCRPRRRHRPLILGTGPRRSLTGASCYRAELGRGPGPHRVTGWVIEDHRALRAHIMPSFSVPGGRARLQISAGSACLCQEPPPCTRHDVGKRRRWNSRLEHGANAQVNGKLSGAILAIHPDGGEARDRGQRDPGLVCIFYERRSVA